MRGPTLNTTAEEAEETVVLELPENKLENESDSRQIQCNYSASNSKSKKEDDDNNRPIWKVGRILIDSLSKGKMRRTKIFAVPLEDLPLNCQGIPKIVQRLCSYLEQFGLKESNLFASFKKPGKLVERFKISFDRAGDADLENCGDVRVIACLLKLWLHDLPQPLIPLRISNRLSVSFQKHNRKEVYDLNAEFSNVLSTCPTLNLGVLYTIIRLLYYYVNKWCSESFVDQLPEMFAKILIRDIEIEHVEIVTTLIRSFPFIFNEKILEKAFKIYVKRDKKCRIDSHKIPEMTAVFESCNFASLVEKLARSNSEEKLCMPSDHNQNLLTQNLNMRRVNSHENFSDAQRNYCCSVQGHFANLEPEKSQSGSLCKFRNSSTGSSGDEKYDNEPVVDNFQKITFATDKDSDVLVAPPPFKYNEDDQIQEKMRDEERFTPQFTTHRSISRKRRTAYQSNFGGFKMHDVAEEDLRSAVPKPGEFFDRNVQDLTYSDESTCLLQWNDAQDCDSQSICSTSSSSSSEHSPSDKVPSSPESDPYSRKHAESFKNYRNWNYTHRHPFNVKSMNSTQLMNNEEPTLSAERRISNIDSKISQMNKHLQWAKKKLRRFENEFEEKYQDTVTGLHKMSHPEYKQLSRTIIFLKNNLKQLRKEANENFLSNRGEIERNFHDKQSFDSFSDTTNKEEIAKNVLNRLNESRAASKRPEFVIDMTHEQLLGEKLSIQKELFGLEQIFGQTAARNEESFKSIYERYRTVKRFLARSSVSLKLKDTLSSLPPIMEDEAMEFDAGSTSTSHYEVESTCQAVCDVGKSDFHSTNIHELSSPELMMEYKITKEEKKKLRNRICVYEQELENQTTTNHQHCIHSLRSRYKNTKAKLKLLEALLMKTK